MATKREETCRNCRKLFLLREEGRHMKRLPFLLACGHTLCGVCILSAGRKAKSFVSCTVCGSRTPFNSREQVEEQFIPNFHLLGLVAAKHLKLRCTPQESVWNSTLSARERSKDNGFEPGGDYHHSNLVTEAKCEECCSKPVEKKCLQCEGFFCDSCFKIVHASANSLRRHRAIPAYQASSPAPTCTTHPTKTLSYYCQSEEVPVCPDCIIQNHKEHNVVSIEEAVEEHQEDFKVLVNEAESVLSAIKTKKQELEAGLQEITAEGLTVCASMEQQMKELYAILQKSEISLHALLMKKMETQYSPLLDMEASLDAEERRIMEVLTRATECMKNDVLLLQNAVELRESLVKIKGLTFEEMPAAEHLSFQLSVGVREALTSAGSVVTDNGKAIELASSAPQPPDTMSSSLLALLELATKEVPSLGTAVAVSTLEDTVVDSSPLEDITVDSTLLVTAVSPMKDTVVKRPASARSSLSPFSVPFVPKKASSSRGSSVGHSSRSGTRSRSRTPNPPVHIPPLSETVAVWVSHVDSPEEFYIQFKCDEDSLQKQAQSLNEAMGKSCQLIPKSEIKEEMRVAAIFSQDGLWYRAEIVKCYLDSDLPSYVTVQYLDYGNSENLSISQLARLPPDLDTQYFSHMCSLAGLQPPSQFSNVAPPSWSNKATQQLKNFVSPEYDEDSVKVCMKEMGKNARGCREVELFVVSPDGSMMPVATKLVQMGLASRSKQPSSKLTLPPPAPLQQPLSGHLEVLVTSCVSPSDFHVRTKANEKMFELIDELLNKSNQKQKVHFTYPGLVCVAQIEGKFYRATVIEISTSKRGGGEGGGGGERWVRVNLVDTGVEERVEEVLELEWKYEQSLINIPSLAVHCRLHNILPANADHWPIEVVKRFKEDVTNTKLEMKICAEGKPLPVELVHRNTQQSIGSMLYVEGLARLEERVGQNKRTKRKKNGNLPVKLVNSVTPPPPPLQELLHPLSLNEQTKTAPGHPLMKPAQNGTHHIPSPSSSISSITLLNVPMHSINSSNPPPPPLSASFSSPSIGDRLQLTVVQVSTPWDFSLQNSSYRHSIQPELGSLPQTLSTNSVWAVGDFCLAPFSGEKWYRVKVEGKQDGKYKVRYVDFGNRGIVHARDLAAMPQNLKRYPDQAIRAKLAGVVPVGGVKWGMEQSVFFSEIVLDHLVTATVQGIFGDVLSVSLVVSGQDVANRMIQAKMARIDPSSVPLPTSTSSGSSSSTGVSDKEEEGEKRRKGRPLENGHTGGATPLISLLCSPTSPSSAPVSPASSMVTPVSPDYPPPPPPPCNLINCP